MDRVRKGRGDQPKSEAPIGRTQKGGVTKVGQNYRVEPVRQPQNKGKKVQTLKSSLPLKTDR